MNAVSFTAEGFGWIIHCIASCIHHFLDYNYYVVSFLIKVTNSLKDSSRDVASNVFDILVCYYYDFLAFLNELNIGLHFIVTVVINFLSKGVFHIYSTICYCGDVIQSLYAMIKVFSSTSVQLLKQAMENCVYFTTVVYDAILLILQLGPNLFILLYESLVYGVKQAILCGNYNLFLILDYLYNFPKNCLNIVYSIPPKAYCGVLLFICLFYTRKRIIKCSKIYLMFLFKVFSFLIVFILSILSTVAFNIKFIFISVINILFMKGHDRRSQFAFNHVQMSSISQSSNKLHAVYKSLKAAFRSIRQNANSELDLDHLQKELSAEKDRHSCVICHDRERNVILFPCRHMCMCEECTLQLQASYQDCPLCRNNILSTLHVYT